MRTPGTTSLACAKSITSLPRSPPLSARIDTRRHHSVQKTQAQPTNVVCKSASTTSLVMWLRHTSKRTPSCRQSGMDHREVTIEYRETQPPEMCFWGATRHASRVHRFRARHQSQPRKDCGDRTDGANPEHKGHAMPHRLSSRTESVHLVTR